MPKKNSSPSSHAELAQWRSGAARRRLTGRLIAHVEALLRLLPIRHISQLTGLHWHTIRTIDAHRLAREVTPPDLSRARRLIKRIAYGYRDSAYFFLKIKAAFPGKAR